MSTTDTSGVVRAARPRGNLTLWLILAVCLLPFIASVALYFFWRPSSFVNYGDLVDPVPLAAQSLREKNGGTFRFDDLHGKWTLLMVDRGRCDEYCRWKLYWMRQVRVAQGPDQERIERVWLVSDGVTPPIDVMTEHGGLRTVAMADTKFLEKLPTDSNIVDHVYIVDPFGNLMMRYPRDLDPSRMSKDIGKLMRMSKGWHQLSR